MSSLSSAGNGSTIADRSTCDCELEKSSNLMSHTRLPCPRAKTVSSTSDIGPTKIFMAIGNAGQIPSIFLVGTFLVCSKVACSGDVTMQTRDVATSGRHALASGHTHRFRGGDHLDTK